MKVTALKNNLLVEELTSTGTFAIPDEHNDGLRLGKVLSASDWVWHICGEKVFCPAKEGDIVYFVFNGNERVHIDGKVCYLLIYDQIRAIVTEL